VVAAEVINGKIAVISAWSEKDMVKQIPGSSWNNEHKVWTLPLSWSACVQLRGIFGQDLTIGEELTKWASLERARRIDPAIALRTRTDVD
jgi:hypothetical protein